MSRFPPPLPRQPMTPPIPAPDAARSVLMFFLGMFGGVGLSLLTWWIFFQAKGGFQALLMVILGLVAVKVTAGVMLSMRQRQRMLGAGLLVSLAVGFLIFAGGFVLGIAAIAGEVSRWNSSQASTPSTAPTTRSSGGSSCARTP